MIKKQTIPVPQSKGLYLDGVTVPGGLSKAENVTILQDGTFERRLYERTLAEQPACLASKGLKNMYELQKSDGTRYLFADIDSTETSVASFGSELITGAAAISAWSEPAGAAWGTYGANWTHADGNVTPLVANVASVIGTQYRVVTSVTCTAPLTTAGNWAYTSTDSTFDWVNWGGGTYTIWSNKWTHTAGATTALTAISDFTPVAGQTYRIVVYAVHTSGTGLSVHIGGKLAGVISSTGSHEFVATFVTNTTALRFVPSSDWVGYVEATEPQGAMAYSRSLSVRKFLDPSGANIASNWGSELITSYWRTANWYPEASASVGQSLTVSIGGVAQTAITESGVYTYDVTATTVGALTYTPTINWAGSVNTASVRAITYGAAADKTKVIGGLVTGTTDYDVSWDDIKIDLTAGDAIQSSWATLQDRAFRVDGTNLNYWFTDAAAVHSLGVPAPDLAPVTASTTGGEITAGTYNVFYTYVKKDAANEYYIVESNPSPQSNITITGAAITVAVVKLVDDDVTHIRIYRTLYSEMGSDAYLALEVANETATHTLIIADDLIGDGTVLTYDNDRPPTGKFVLGAGSRLWLIDTNGLLHWSKLDYPEQMPGLNQQSFDPKDGDEVMGMCALRSNLLVFKRRRTWLMNMFSQSTDEDGNAALAKDIVSSTLGCIATGSIQSAGQESAIWLSAAGIILYDGGTFRNISGGDIQTGTPSRIQSVINNFMANDAETSITSMYHSTKQLYHINFLYRTGAEITSQRHFVYSIITDTWTEYVYRVNETQARLYVTNITLAHDSYGNEVVLVPHLVAAAGTAVYIYQGDWAESYSPATTTRLLSVACMYSMCDSSDNVYAIQTTGLLHKVTSAGVASVLVSAANISARGWPDTIDCDDGVSSINFISDMDNSRVFVQLRTVWDASWLSEGGVQEILSTDVVAHGIFKITTAGVMTDLSIDTISGSYVHTKLVGIKSDSSVLYVLTWDNYRQTAAPTYFRLSSMNVTTGALTTLYEFENITQAIAAVMDITPYMVYNESLYWFRAGNLYVMSGLGGTEALSEYTTNVTSTYLCDDIYVDGIGDIYLIMSAPGRSIFVVSGFFYRGSPISDTAWEFLPHIDITHRRWSYHTDTEYASRQYMIHKNTAGNYILESIDGYSGENGDGFVLFGDDWELLGEFSNDGAWPYGLSIQQGVSWRSTNENVFVCCGRAPEGEGVYKVIPIWDGWFDASMTPIGTVADIVSNYIDLGISEDKRVCGVSLDTVSQYPSVGKFALESNYNINNALRVDDETAEVAGSVSRLTFGHPGEKTWNTTSTFDSSVEQWRTHEIGVGLSGQSFRYSIKVGDIVGGGHGTLKIRPPKIEVQVKGKPSDERGGR